MLQKFRSVLVRETVSPEYGETVVNESADDLMPILKDLLGMDKSPQEELWAVYLDVKRRVVGLSMVSRGGLSHSVAEPAAVFRQAILSNACGIILAHNHPSGDPTPSVDDINVTKRIKEAGEILGIKLLDHIVVADTYVSMKESGLL